MKIILFYFLLLFTLLQADTFELSPYSKDDTVLVEPEPVYKEDSNPMEAGLALDIKPTKSENLNIKLAYEGDFMILNDYIPEEKKIQNNNYYIGVGYKF